MTPVLLVLCFVLMALGTKLVTKAVKGFIFGLTARGWLTAAAVVLVLATSLPEFFVVLAAVFSGRGQVSLANLLAVNVADLSLVIGGGALILGSIPIVGDFWRWELAAAFLAGVAPILLMMDGSLSRIDGLILITLFLIYVEGFVIGARGKILAKMGIERPGIIARLAHRFEKKENLSVIEFVGGVVMMALSAYGLVLVSDRFWVSPIVFGLVVVTLATTLPEYLEFFHKSTKKDIAVILSNLLGSVVTNATLLVGLLALLHPIKVFAGTIFPMTNLAFVVIFGLFWMFTSTKQKLERWEGLILVGIFITFVGLVLLSPSV